MRAGWHHARIAVASALALALAACGGGAGDDEGEPPRPRRSKRRAAPPDAAPVAVAREPDVAVYAHSAQELYRIDPERLQVTLVGQFGWPAGLRDAMTDIAIDGEGRMIGISHYRVYQVDPRTAACTLLATLDRPFNALSFVPPVVTSASSTGAAASDLVAAAWDGTIWRLDPESGRTTRLGHYGQGLRSSGDLVSIEGFGTLATILKPDRSTDVLVRVNPRTGEIHEIGDTGVSGIWGLGFWKGRVYGFTYDGQFVLIDVDTGAATAVERTRASFWGAGVTTRAPYLP